MTTSEINQILIYFCSTCLADNYNLKFFYKEYTKENSKPLFNSHKILTVFNLYVYHTLLELFKILKFRTPYCIYEIFSHIGSKHNNITICIPIMIQQCQRRTFTYQSRILWNKFYKHLLVPFSIPLHRDYILKFNLTESESIHYDYSTKISQFKSNLSGLLMNKQLEGDRTSWAANNYYNIPF